MRPLLIGLVTPIFLSSLTLQAQVPAQTDDAAIAYHIDRALGLVRSLPVNIGIQQVNGRVYASLDSAILLELSWHSVRAPGYRLLVQRADGSIVQQKPAPVRTLRGHIVGLPGTVVAASLVDRGISARIQTAKGEDYWLQPVPAVGPGALPGRHVLYRAADVIKGGHTCAADRLVRLHRAIVPVGGGEGSPNSGGGTPMQASSAVAQLACDADYEYFKSWGSDVNTVAARITSVINTMNLQYERDVGITHAITSIVVRTSSSQPYTSTDSFTLLKQFRTEWNTNQASVSRDVAQLFTGKNLDGNTIGIAWVGTVCNLSFAYSVVESDFSSTLTCITDLSAHELGHSWNADHCRCNNYTMNGFITCANRFHDKRSIPEIVRFRDTRTCLGAGGGGTATTVEASVTASVEGVGKGLKRGKAVIVVTDNLGTPRSGVLVAGQFSGAFSDSFSATATDANGMVTFTTAPKAVRGKVSVTFCVTSLTNLPTGLTWSQSPKVCDSN